MVEKSDPSIPSAAGINDESGDSSFNINPFLVLVLMLFIISVYYVATGAMVIPDGDPASRLLIAYRYVFGTWKEFFPSIDNFLAPKSAWPPLSFMLNGLIGRFWVLCGSNNAGHLVRCWEFASLVICFGGIFFWYSAVKETYGKLHGIFSGIILAGLPVLLEFNYTLMTELEVFSLFGVAIWCLARYYANERPGRSLIYLSVAGFMFLTASVFHAESVYISIAAALTIVVFSFRKWWHAGLFLCISLAYSGLRFIYLRLFYPNDTDNFLNATMKLTHANDMSVAHWNIRQIIIDVTSEDGLYFLAFGILLFVMTLFYFSYARRFKQKTKSENGRARLRPMTFFLTAAFLLGTGLVFHLIYTGKINSKTRYLAHEMCLFGTLIGIQIGLIVEAIGRNARRFGRIVRIGTIFAAIILCTLSFTRVLRKNADSYGYVTQTADYISKSKLDRESLIFDISLQEELIIQLYTRPFLLEKKSYTEYGERPLMAVPPSAKALKASDQSIALAHKFMGIYRPAYAILTSPSRYDMICRSGWSRQTVGGRPNSFFRPFFKQKSNGEFNMISQFIPDLNVTFHHVYHNQDYEIYRLDYIQTK